MSYSNEANALIELLADRPVAYHPVLARALGGVKAAIFLGQLLYWHGKGAREDGYIWKTQAEFEEETALSRREQEGARCRLKKLDVLEEKLAGVPARLHYRVKLVQLAQIVQASMHQTAKLDCTKPPNLIAPNRQTIPESTPQTTTESTPEKEHGPAPAGATIPVNLEGWQDSLRESKNRNATLKEMIATLYPHSVVPEFGYIGRVARNVGGAGRLAELLWKAVGGRPSGDLLRYVQAMARNNGRNTGPPQTDQQREDAEYLRSIVNH